MTGSRQVCLAHEYAYLQAHSRFRCPGALDSQVLHTAGSDVHVRKVLRGCVMVAVGAVGLLHTYLAAGVHGPTGPPLESLDQVAVTITGDL